VSSRIGARVDDSTGEAVDNYGGDIAIALDKDLIRGKLFAALNFVYDPEVTRSRVTDLWQRESTLGFFGSVTTQFQLGFFAGVEVRYFRTYDAASPERFTRPSI
jgi:hypothetical protein